MPRPGAGASLRGLGSTPRGEGLPRPPAVGPQAAGGTSALGDLRICTVGEAAGEGPPVAIMPTLSCLPDLGLGHTSF